MLTDPTDRDLDAIQREADLDMLANGDSTTDEYESALFRIHNHE